MLLPLQCLCVISYGNVWLYFCSLLIIRYKWLERKHEFFCWWSREIYIKKIFWWAAFRLSLSTKQTASPGTNLSCFYICLAHSYLLKNHSSVISRNMPAKDAEFAFDLCWKKIQFGFLGISALILHHHLCLSFDISVEYFHVSFIHFCNLPFTNFY